MFPIGCGIIALFSVGVFTRSLGPRDLDLKTLTYKSTPLPIRGLIPSMEGPSHSEKKSFSNNKGRPKLLWLTGITTAAFDGDTSMPVPLGNLCHTGVMTAEQWQKNARGFSVGENQAQQMAVMFPGVTRIRFPKNFALPLRSDMQLEFMAMGFNQDPNQASYNLVVEQSLEYFEDSTSDVAVKPLYHRMARLFLPARDPGSAADHCEMGHEDATVEKATNFEGKTAAHWIVPPGRHTYRAKLDAGLGLRANTTMHYAYVHLHAYGKSLELRDLTEGRTIFKSIAHPYAHSPDIEKSDIFSSETGIPVYTDHSYELISEYDNTSDRPVTAMAMMYFYFADHEFLNGINKSRARRKQMRDLASAE